MNNANFLVTFTEFYGIYTSGRIFFQSKHQKKHEAWNQTTFLRRSSLRDGILSGYR